MKASFTIEGDKQLTRALKGLEPKVGKKLVKKAMRPAMRIVQAKAKQEAPVLTGATKKAIKVRAAKKSRRSFGIDVRIGKGDYKGDEYYASFVEYGTSKMEPRPFMRPAYASEAEPAKEKARTELLKLIDEEVSKANTGG